MIAVLSVLVAVVATALCLLDCLSVSIFSVRMYRITVWLYGCVCAFGIVCCGIGCGTYASILYDVSLTEEYIAWATDAIRIAIRCGGFLTALIGGAVLAAALIRHPFARIRRVVACAGAILIALLGRAYSAMCVTESASPAVPIQWFAAGFAGLMLCGSLVDAIYRVRHPAETQAYAQKIRRKVSKKR